MVVEKIIVKQKRQRVHTRYKAHEDALFQGYTQEHVNTHRRVNRQVLNCLEEIGEL